MRLLWIIGAVALLSACGGGGRAMTVDPAKQTASQPPSPSAVASAGDGPAAANVQPLLTHSLLGLSDMPTGWTISPPNSSPDSKMKICGTTSADVASSLKAESTFQKSQTGPFLFEVLGQYPTSDESSGSFKKLRDATNSCSTWMEPDKNGKQSTWRIAALSFPSYGDETFAFRLSTDPTILGVVDADCVVVRYGRVVMLIVYVGVSFTGLDSNQTQAFIEKAEAKLKPAIHSLN